MMKTRQLSWTIVCLSLCLLLANCGGNEEGNITEEAQQAVLDSLTLDSLRKINKEIDSIVSAQIDTTYQVPDTLNRFFAKYGVTGAFVMFDPQQNIFYYHDVERVDSRVEPAGNFYMPLALIALETGALADTATVFKWDGKDYGKEEWNKDQQLREALIAQTPWFFDILVQKVGPKRLQHHLNELEYGNRRVGTTKEFWEDGTLLISMKDHLRFLRALYRETLPFSRSSMRLIKSTLNTTPTEGYQFSTHSVESKYGNTPQAWLTGYLIFSGEVPKGFYFATVVDIEEEINAPDAAEAVTLDILRHMKLLR